jgi:hypothetical protein
LDFFTSFYSEKNKAYLVNDYIRKQKHKFSLVNNSEYRQALFNYCLFADKLLHKDEPITHYNSVYLVRALRSGCTLALSKEKWAIDVKDAIQKDFETSETVSTHWLSGIKDLGVGFYSQLVHRIEDYVAAVNTTKNQRKQVRVPNDTQTVKMIFEGLSTVNGTQFEYSLSDIIIFFNDAKDDLFTLEDKIENMAKYLGYMNEQHILHEATKAFDTIKKSITMQFQVLEDVDLELFSS